MTVNLCGRQVLCQQWLCCISGCDPDQQLTCAVCTARVDVNFVAAETGLVPLGNSGASLLSDTQAMQAEGQ